jgi:hypothetical protein
MIALDEAFAGIDDRYKPELLGLTVTFGLDLFMTGHDLWVHYDTVPMAAHYDMHHDKAAHAVSAMLMLWDGTQTIDADAGFSGNDELAAGLLGITPSRHTPASTEGTLLAALPEDDEPNDEDGGAGHDDAVGQIQAARIPEAARGGATVLGTYRLEPDRQYRRRRPGRGGT